MMYAEVIFPFISDKPYTYSIPEGMEESIKIGIRVLAPVGNRNATGFVVTISAQSKRKDLKELIDALDAEPIFTKDLWELTKWMSSYYYCDWGDVLKTCFPKESRFKSSKVVKIKNNIELSEAINKLLVKTKVRMKVLQEIFLKKEIQIEKLKKKTGVKNINSILNEFLKLNIISIESKLVGGKIKYKKVITLSDELKDREIFKSKINEIEKSSHKQLDLLLYLYSQLSFSEKPELYSSLIKSKRASHSIIKNLQEKGLIKIEMHEMIRKSVSDYTEPSQDIILNKFQDAAVKEINNSIDKSRFSPFLLYGVTGSGKTQVYIEVIKYAICQGKSAIVLVPEISLTPQLVHRFQKHFGDKIAVIHSRMSAGERYDSWRMILEGKCNIVVGARSAIFAPIKNLGAIIVDEEHEPSYKQFDMSPRYNARDTAIMRAIYAKATIVLGSATPSIESFYNAQSGKYKLLELPERVDNAQLPEIEIIDMKKEWKSRRLLGSLSFPLKEKIKNRLEKNEGIILLQNHRGFSTYSKCLNCGYVETCDNCNVTLTYHKIKNHLRCHYCGFIKEVSSVCPKCYSDEMKFGGIGTQRVEEELIELFPEVKMLRMDLDTTAKKGSHTNILKQFGEGKANILLGTQMVAKGLDFPRVTLVGVILADMGLHFPDFRSNERTFQLLTQVAGRAGRSTLRGEVVIQTFLPNHYCFQFVRDKNYLAFYNYEISERQKLLYPPFGRIILIEFKGEVEAEVSRLAQAFFHLFSTYHTYKAKKIGKDFCRILGPSSAAISKIRNQYRIHLILKSDKKVDPNLKLIRDTLDTTIEQYERKFKLRKVKYTIDVDPQGML